MNLILESKKWQGIKKCTQMTKQLRSRYNNTQGVLSVISPLENSHITEQYSMVLDNKWKILNIYFYNYSQEMEIFLFP